MLLYLSIAVSALVVFVVIVALILLQMSRQPNEVTQAMQAAIAESLEQLREATQQHVEVSAVVEILRKFEDDPSQIERIAPYADQVAAGVLLYRVNSLGAAANKVQDELRWAITSEADYASPAHTNRRQQLEQFAEYIGEQLEAARVASRRFSGNTT